MFFPAEVRLDEAKQSAAGRKAVVLATTTDDGYLKPDTFGLNRIPDEPPNPTSRGRHPVMVAIEGRFESLWKGKPSPAAPPPEPADETPSDAKPADAKPADAKPADAKPSEEKPAEPAPESPAPSEAPKAPEGAPDSEGARGPRGPEGEDADDGEDPKPPAGEAPPPSAPPADAPAPDAPPASPPAPPAPPASPPAPPPPPPGPARLDEGSGTLVVVGDAELVSDAFSGDPRRDRTGGVTQLRLRTTGFPFLANAVDWSVGNDELAALRGRGAPGRVLQDLEADDASKVRRANYLVLPLGVVLAGVMVWLVRRYRS
jgi:hypothetical protein